MSQPIPQRHTVKRGANHGLHLVLTILTCGLWALTGWPIAALLGRKTTTTTTMAAPAPPHMVQPYPTQYVAPPVQHPYPPQQYGAPPQQPAPPYGQQYGAPPQQ